MIDFITRKELGFNSIDERSEWYFGDILTTPERREEARQRYEEVLQTIKCSDMRFSHENEEIQNPNTQRKDREYSYPSNHKLISDYIHETDSFDGLFN